MNNGRNLRRMTFIVCTILGLHANCYAKTETSPWPLSGTEVLIQISDPKGDMPQGIYAWDPAKTEGRAELKLLIKGGHNAVWSPHHKRIAYLFNGDIWIADKEGRKNVFTENIPIARANSQYRELEWSPGGAIYFTRYFPSWGSAVCVSGATIENTDVKDLRAFYSVPNLWGIKPFGKALTDSTQKPSPGYNGDLRWSDLFTTNNATFSPDGRFVAVEKYPAMPFDLGRVKSYIQVYEQIKFTGTREKIIESIHQSGTWFSDTGHTSVLKGPGRRLVVEKADRDETTELKPLWSPTSDEIVFTAVNAKTGVVIPVVTSSKGTVTTTLNLPNFSILPDFSSWVPAHVTINKDMTAKSTTVWGNVNRTALAWSDDGKYLWMREEQNGLSVAKQQDGKWLIHPVKANNPSDNAVLLMPAFRDQTVLWFEDSGDLRKILNVHIFDAETGKAQTYSLRSALKVLSVDW